MTRNPQQPYDLNDYTAMQLRKEPYDLSSSVRTFHKSKSISRDNLIGSTSRGKLRPEIHRMPIHGVFGTIYL
mgnify:CR=1 FL=1